MEKGLAIPVRQWHEGQAIATKLPLDHARKAKAPASGASKSLIHNESLVGVRGFEPPASTSRT